MSELERQLRQRADEAASRAQMQNLHVQKRLSDLKAEVAQLMAAVDAGSLAPKRRLDYKAKIGIDYQCPDCWIVRGVQAQLIPQSSPTAIDLFKCSQCDSILPSRA